MTPRADGLFLAFSLIGVGLVGTLAAFRIADWATEGAVRLARRARFALAPACVDCGGRGWRRWRVGDGPPLEGWTDCRLCRGLGRIVDDEEGGE